MHTIADVLLASALAAGAVYLLLRRTLRAGERALEALRVNEARFRHLTALSADWFWETDRELRVTWLSGGPAVATLFRDEAVYGRRLWEVGGVEIAPAGIAEQLQRHTGDEAPPAAAEFELIWRSADGAARVHALSGQPRFDEAGRFAGYRGVGRDVSERRLAELALGEAKERLELATEGGNVAIWDIELATDTIYLSAGWARLLGEHQAPHVGRSAELLELVHPQDQAPVRVAFVRAVVGNAPRYVAEYRVRTASGDWKWVLSTGRVTQRDHAGRALRMSGTVADIDARKRAEQATRDAEERYRSLIELAPDGVLVHSGGIVEFANAAAVRLFRAGSPQRLMGMRIADLIHPEHRERVRERLAYLETGPGTVSFEERKLPCLDGSETVVEAASVSYLARGRLVVQAVLRDVTERRQARERLAERERRFRDVVEASGEYVWETDPAWRYTYLSERVEAVLGYRRDELLGRTPREFMPLGEFEAVGEWFERHAAAGKPFRELIHRSLHKSGKVVWQSVSGVPVHDAAGALVALRGTGADITARKQAEARLQHLATRDALTGLPNRALLADRANQAILSAAHARAPLALLVADLDRFQLVNDSLGHRAGDALLVAVAERLAGTLRRDDTLARLDGDEFALLSSGLCGPQDAVAAARGVQAVLARPFTIEGRALGVTASIGIALYPHDGRDFAELLKNADAAAHRAKEIGRNGFRFFSRDLNASAAARLAMENDLREAIARSELCLYWQPVLRVDAAARVGAARMVGAEALLRWRHPRDGLLSPDAFVPIAEECGLIGPLGTWTLGRALSQFGAWRRRGATELWLALNVSASELARGEEFVAQLSEALAANQVPGACLELEVTERVLMADLPNNVATLQSVGALGVRVAIDDFGTGYSSLAYLRRLPVDKLKIDRSFLREIEANPADATIVQAIAAMARGLGLHVAAEGVENQGQLERLLALGCDEWQGHYYSAPLEPAAFERLLGRRAVAAS